MKKLICLVLVLTCVFSVLTINVSANEGEMNIYGIYLSKNGDATLIESNGKWLLIDTGFETSAEELIEKLEGYDIKSLQLLISHYHYDHIGGIEALVDSKIKIEKVYMPDASLLKGWDSAAYFIKQVKTWVGEKYSAGSITEFLTVGETFEFGDVDAKVIGPVGKYKLGDFSATASQTAEEKYVNNRSLVVKFNCGGTSFLTAGDIEDKEEEALVDKYKGTKELKSDVMKLSHHALSTSNTVDFLKAVSPKYTFAHNSEKIYSENEDYDKNYRLYYTVCKTASKYGPVYLIGDEKKDFGAKVSSGKIKIYRGTKQLKGLVSLAGGDGKMVKNYKYYITTSQVKEGVYTIDDKKYYVLNGGFVEKAFYSYDLGKMVYRYQPEENGDIRYIDKEGVLYTGFRKVNDYYRYFDKETGVMLIGSKGYAIKKIGSKKYAINENGIVYNYKAKSGAWKKFGTKYRYFDKNGVMKTGWLTIGSKKYYLNKTSGYRTVGLKKISGKTYYFVEKNSAAYAYNSGWKKFGTKYRYFDKNGVMKTGWLTVGGKKYYLNKETGYRTVGLKKISGKTYYFVEKNKAGYAYNSGWKKFGSKYRYFDKNGVMATGSKKINGKTYKFDKNGYRK